MPQRRLSLETSRPREGKIAVHLKGGCNREANMFHRNPTLHARPPTPSPWLRAQAVFREGLIA